MVLPLVRPRPRPHASAPSCWAQRAAPVRCEYRRWFELLAAAVSGARSPTRVPSEDERRRAEALTELGSRQDHVLLEREPRVPHAARAHARAARDRPGRDALPADSAQHLEVARRNSQRLLKLVNTLLDFSRIEGGRVAGEPGAGGPSAR
jgi:signal transduction histidine kinase